MDAQKLKLFPLTLKDATLCWFMEFWVNSIWTWDEIKIFLLNKYQDYCKFWDIKEEIFKMSQLGDEILEGYVERF